MRHYTAGETLAGVPALERRIQELKQKVLESERRNVVVGTRYVIVWDGYEWREKKDKQSVITEAEKLKKQYPAQSLAVIERTDRVVWP